MRTLGIAAIFVLSLVSIVEGAFLFRLSRQVRTLADVRGAVDEHEEIAAPARPSPPAHAPRPRPITPSALPSFQTLAPPSTTPATTTLREALATSEGREQLKAAMEIIAEEKRQTRLVDSLPRRAERDQRYRERIMKAVPLTGDEPLKLTTMFTTLQAARQQAIDDMHAGLKNAEDTDNALDSLREDADKQIRALLGDDRWHKVQAGRRGGQQQQGATATATPSGAPVAAGNPAR